MDDNDIGNFLSEMESTKMDFNAIITVTDDKQALGNLKKENCLNLVFLDLNMPVMDGFSFLARALKELLCMQMNMIILASFTCQKDKDQASQFGRLYRKATKLI